MILDRKTLGTHQCSIRFSNCRSQIYKGKFTRINVPIIGTRTNTMYATI